MSTDVSHTSVWFWSKSASISCRTCRSPSSWEPHQTGQLVTSSTPPGTSSQTQTFILIRLQDKHWAWIGNRFHSQSDWFWMILFNLVKLSFATGQEVSCLFRNVKIGATLTLKAGSCPSLIRWSSRINSIDFSQNIVTTKKIVKTLHWRMKTLCNSMQFRGNSPLPVMITWATVVALGQTSLELINWFLWPAESWEVILRLVDSFRFSKTRTDFIWRSGWNKEYGNVCWLWTKI